MSWARECELQDQIKALQHQLDELTFVYNFLVEENEKLRNNHPDVQAGRDAVRLLIDHILQKAKEER